MRSSLESVIAQQCQSGCIFHLETASFKLANPVSVSISLSLGLCLSLTLSLTVRKEEMGKKANPVLFSQAFPEGS